VVKLNEEEGLFEEGFVKPPTVKLYGREVKSHHHVFEIVIERFPLFILHTSIEDNPINPVQVGLISLTSFGTNMYSKSPLYNPLLLCI